MSPGEKDASITKTTTTIRRTSGEVQAGTVDSNIEMKTIGAVTTIEIEETTEDMTEEPIVEEIATIEHT
jgi:hypothetical protein